MIEIANEHFDSALTGLQVENVLTGIRGVTGILKRTGETGYAAAVPGTDYQAPIPYTPGMVNPNLLDNWYFGNPVNQRGVTSWSNGYGIDRWRSDGTGVSTLTVDGEVTISSPTGDTTRGTFEQRVENFADLKGKTFTFSVLCSALNSDSTRMFIYDGNNYFGTRIENTGITSITYTLPTSATRLWVSVRAKDNTATSTGEYVSIKAVKLELGSVQTLAHQENSVWVLNEIPNYGEQLIRCMRYCQLMPLAVNSAPFAAGYGFSTTSVRVSMPLPVRLRTAPTITYLRGNVNLFGLVSSNGTIRPTALYISQSENSALALDFTVSNAVQNEIYILTQSSSNVRVLLSADL